MVKCVKVILVFLFAVLLHNAANDFFTGHTVKEDDSVTLALSANIPEAVVATAQMPYLPDAELAGTGMQLHQITLSRIQRINASEYLLSLKSLAQKLVEREAALTQHQGRIYNTTTSYFCHPASEYYVFALRRIIV